MTQILTASQMRAIETSAIERGEVSGLELMERAGKGVVKAILERHPNADREFPVAAVFCGPGNNGGDGFVIARLLKARNWDVHVFLMGDWRNFPPDARTNYERWCEIGAVQPYETDTILKVARDVRRQGAKIWIAIDALFGIGQRGPLDDALAPLNALIQKTWNDDEAAPTPFFVCVDVPTGYDTDTGDQIADHPVSGMVVTFHALKPVHEVPNVCQEEVRVVDIGLKP